VRHQLVLHGLLLDQPVAHHAVVLEDAGHRAHRRARRSVNRQRVVDQSLVAHGASRPTRKASSLARRRSQQTLAGTARASSCCAQLQIVLALRGCAAGKPSRPRSETLRSESARLCMLQSFPCKPGLQVQLIRNTILEKFDRLEIS
jgi:hypothetical protein